MTVWCAGLDEMIGTWLPETCRE